MSIEQEIRRREKLWKQIRNEYDDLENLERKRLNQLKIYFGGSGVWVDKKDSTGEISSDRNGVTVGLLHTGRHYADDLSREGIIYHYPKTNRTGHRDQNEIAATKNAKRLDIPVFVILPGKKIDTRCLKIGWITDWSDEEEIFHIKFGEFGESHHLVKKFEPPFQLQQKREKIKTTTTKTRPHQEEFRFNILKKYGSKCAVCEIRHKELIHAAHIRGIDENGSDHIGNGIPLCGTHHLAFDKHFFCFKSENNEIIMQSDINRSSIAITESTLNTKNHVMPHKDAINWKEKRTKEVWKQ